MDQLSMDQLRHDLGYSIRTLAGTPAFTILCVLVLGLGIGVHTAVLRVINGLIFNTTAGSSPDSLRYLYTVDPPGSGPFGGTRYQEFEQLRKRAQSFSHVASTAIHEARVRVGNRIDRVKGEAVSRNYFETLGVRPVLGRDFATQDELASGDAVAIINYQLWQVWFHGDTDVLGASLEVNRSARVGSYGPWKRYTIVGVMPGSFHGLASPWDATQYWVPFLQRAQELADQYRANGRTPPELSDFWVLPVARLADGISEAQAGAEVAAFSQVFRSSRPGNEDWALRMFEGRRIQLPFDPDGRLMPDRLAVGLLMVAAALLIIVAAHLAGMFMTRAVLRRTDHAVRIAVGCGPWRLWRQECTVALLLSLAGGATGVIVSKLLIEILTHDVPPRLIRLQAGDVASILSIDATVMGLVALTSVTTAIISMVPTVRTILTSGCRAAMGDGVISTPAARGRLWRVIVAPQVCLSFVLLVAAWSLAKTLIRAEFGDSGYDGDRVVLLDCELPEIVLPAGGWNRELGSRIGEQRRTVQATLLRHIRSAAQIRAASISLTSLPHRLPFPALDTWVSSQNDIAEAGTSVWVSYASVSSDYFAALGIPILRGRGFSEGDGYGSTRVAVVSEHLARLLWAKRDPLGQNIGIHPPGSRSNPEWFEVVGIVRDVRPPLRDGPRPSFYTAVAQELVPPAFTIVAKGEGTGAELVRALTAAAAAADSSLLVSNGRTLHAAIDEMVYPRRAVALLLGIAGVVGVVVASFGLYGVVSFSVAQRSQEIGVRMALGAQRRDIMGMILREGFGVALSGLGMGVALLVPVMGLTRRYFMLLPSGDGSTVVIVASLVSIVMSLACYLPAARASQVDPRESLRTL